MKLIALLLMLAVACGGTSDPPTCSAPNVLHCGDYGKCCSDALPYFCSKSNVCLSDAHDAARCDPEGFVTCR